jgi:hypothetical protein
MCILGDGWRTTVEGERMTTSFQAAKIKRGKGKKRRFTGSLRRKGRREDEEDGLRLWPWACANNGGASIIVMRSRNPRKT